MLHFSNWAVGAVALLIWGCGQSNAGGGSGVTAGAAGSAGEGVAGAVGGSSAGGLAGEGSASAGQAGSAGQASAGQAGSAGSSAMMPPVKVSACDGLAAPGVFEEITPPTVKANIGMMTSDNQTKSGTFAMAVDPINQGTVYAGTLFQGVWKSTDCGATWTAIATGMNGSDVNRGMNWTFAIDPTDSNVLYTNSGYGSNGLFKSTDGGVNWTDIWSAQSQPTLAKAFTYNFANVVAIDPGNHLHILLTFHEPCLAPHPSTCIAETMDAGSTWRLIDGEPSWDGNEGQVIFFLDSSATWLWGSQSSGFWRSPDSGATWQAIPNMNTSHLQSSQILRTKNGTFFAAGADGIWRSPDGKAANWKLVPDTGPIAGGLVTDGTTMYSSNCYFDNFCMPKYSSSPEADGNTWTTMPSPVMSQGGNLGYDKAHKLLYSSNLAAGMWRVVVP